MTPAPGAQLTIRRAGAPDLPALIALETASFDHPWSAALLRAELEAPYSFALVAPAPETPEAPHETPYEVGGYAVFRVLAGEAELLRVAVRPGTRRRGLGAGLVRAGLAHAAERGAACCFLEVRTDNRPAIELYRRLGFHEEGRRSGYYTDGADALVMALELHALRDEPGDEPSGEPSGEPAG